MKKIFFLLITFLIIVICCIKENTEYILAIGDSHGAHDNGWVKQLQSIRIHDSIINFSISGNTIGFNNLNRDTLNTLKNINQYLKNSIAVHQHLDKIIVLLGTNDCKAIYDSLQVQVIQNFDSLMQFINTFPYPMNKKPEIIIVSPPPAANDSILLPKYQGISRRLDALVPAFQKIAEKYNYHFIDIYSPLREGFDTLNADGIHLNEKGYALIADQINKSL